MRDQYKVLAEKYEQVLEAGQEPVMTVNKIGTKEWWRDGKRHRLDGPAIEWPNGSNQWYRNDKLHRLDGPAIELSDGEKAWFINGKEYSENEFNKEIWNRNPMRRNILKKASDKTGIEMDI